MISNAKLKYCASFKLSKNCAAEKVFVIEGEKIAREALAANIPLRMVCATADWLERNAQLISEKIADANIFEISEPELERISNLQTPNKVWLLAEQPQQPELQSDSKGLTLVLDHIQDPGNMGTIIRIADWFGIRRVVCSTNSANYLNSKVVQASMGSIFRTEIHYTDLPVFLEKCQGKDIPIYGALLDGDNIYEIPLETNALIVIGNESKGIGKETEKYITHKVSIPNFGGSCESLNASVATGIICSEFRRRQG